MFCLTRFGRAEFSMTGSSRLQDIRLWLRLAQDNLLLAEAIVSRRDAAPRIACFHAQQAVEKTLKAALLSWACVAHEHNACWDWPGFDQAQRDVQPLRKQLLATAEHNRVNKQAIFV